MSFKRLIFILYLNALCIYNVRAQQNKLLPDTLVFCEGDSAYIELKQPPENNYSITWFTPYNIITNIKKIKALKPGKYQVKVSYPRFKSPMFDSTFVKLFSKQKSIVKDTVLCRDQFIWLEESRKGVQYLWNSGEITAKIKVVSAGNYYVNANYGSCSVTDTFKVKLSPVLGVALASETVFCNNNNIKSIQVNAFPSVDLVWNTGTKGNYINIFKEGNYWVKSSYAKCSSKVDSIKVKFKACDCEILVPNSFTPNDDFKNDYFFPVISCEYTYYNLLITDRWGNTVFSSSSINAKWDGRYKGNLCPEDIYVYKIESLEKGSDKRLVRSGHVALFR